MTRIAKSDKTDRKIQPQDRREFLRLFLAGTAGIAAGCGGRRPVSSDGEIPAAERTDAGAIDGIKNEAAPCNLRYPAEPKCRHGEKEVECMMGVDKSVSFNGLTFAHRGVFSFYKDEKSGMLVNANPQKVIRFDVYSGNNCPPAIEIPVLAPLRVFDQDVQNPQYSVSKTIGISGIQYQITVRNWGWLIKNSSDGRAVDVTIGHP